MKLLTRILRKKPDKMADADHPDRPDITRKQFDEALTAVVDRYKDKQPANPMTEREDETRSMEILQALNSTKDPY